MLAPNRGWCHLNALKISREISRNRDTPEKGCFDKILLGIAQRIESQ